MPKAKAGPRRNAKPEQPSESRASGISVVWVFLAGLGASVVGVVVFLVVTDPNGSSSSTASGPYAPGRTVSRDTSPRVEPPDRVLQQLDAMVARGQLDRAQAQLKELRRRYPNSAGVKLLLGQIADKQSRLKDAIELYDAVLPSHPRWYPLALFQSADARLRDGDFEGAEERLRKLLRRQPNHLDAHVLLVRVLTLESRRWESLPHLLTLIRAGRTDMLPYAGNLFAVVDEDVPLRQARRRYPQQYLPALGLARIEMKNGRWDQAEQLLTSVLEHRTDVVEAHVAWGELLVERARWQEAVHWAQHLPSEAANHPAAWRLQGRIAEATGQIDAAIRCYWESIRRYGGDRRPYYRAGNLLIRSNRKDAGSRFLSEAKRLDAFSELVWLNIGSATSVNRALRTAFLAEELGRYIEAEGWYRLARQLDPTSEDAREGMQRVMPLAQATNRTVATEKLLVRQYRFDDFPLPDWSRITAPQLAQGGGSSTVPLRFENQARDWGVEFQIENGDDPDQLGFHIWQSAGGGISVLDYDADGWPDLYAAQENRDAFELDHGLIDQLFRNVGGESYVDVTHAARLNEFRYSQSVAVGDYNGDGFPDLLVANIGPSRLLRNEGDGTFTDVTDEVGLKDKLWTTAAAMVDLNRDGLDELMLIHYLAGREPFTKQCREGNIVSACRPTIFAPESDALYWNRGDGTFAAGELRAAPGRGLGIVAADFDGNGGVDMFISNDMTANHLYWNDLTPGEKRPLVDSALLSGVAVDGEGRSQACMGIALGDVDRNGLPDLFVTNFFRESNTLYAQQPGQLFTDRTAEARLRDSSLSVLGFGTQFIDFDLDGWLDVMIANGFVDQTPSVEYRMPTQVYRNVGQGVFQQQDPAKVGDYFTGRYLGRGLSAIDANRDGRPDVAVSHLDASLALLINTTESSHHFVSLRLVSRESGRSVGAVIEATVGAETQRRDITAGDGYAAANDRRIVIGIGQATQLDRLTIRWPSGRKQVFQQVPADRHWIVVEGWDRLRDWPRD